MAIKKKVSKKKTPTKVETAFGNKLLAFMKVKAKITKANKVVDELKSQASEMEKELIINFEETKTLRADVKLGSVTLKKDDIFIPKDWNKIWAYIHKKKDNGLVQKRLSSALLKEYWEDGVKIPGVEHGTKKKLGVGFKRS